MKRSCLALLLLFAPSMTLAQVNPATQIKWPMVTGHGAPAGACTPTNYGQPYTNLDAAAQQVRDYKCTSTGWQNAQGPQGGIGPAGPPQTFLGFWSSTQTYSKGQAVSYTANGLVSTYVSLVDNNTNNVPPNSATQWALSAQGSNTAPVGNAGAVQFNNNGNLGGAGVTIDPASGNNLTAAQGMYPQTIANPDAPLANFRTQLTAAQAQLVRVAIISDSIHADFGPSTYKNGVTEVLRNYLSQYGDGGHGMTTVGYDGSNETTGSQFFTRPEWTAVGTWNKVGDLGPSQAAPGPYTSIFVGAGGGTSLTLAPQYGTTLEVYTEQTADNAGCTVTVDGTVLGTINTTTAGTPTPEKDTFTVAQGSHTLVIAPSGAGKCYMYGAGFTNSTGVVVDNFSIGFMRSGAFGSNVATQLAYLSQISPAPAMALIDLGTNDTNNNIGITPAQYQQNLQNIVTYLKTNFPQISIMLESIYTGSAYSAQLPQSIMNSTVKGLAVSNNTAYFNMADIWGEGSQNNQKALALMAGDSIHPSDKGAANFGYEKFKRIIGTGNQSLNQMTFPWNTTPAQVGSAEQYPSPFYSTATPAVNGITPGIGTYKSSFGPGFAAGIGSFNFGNFGGGPGLYQTWFVPSAWLGWRMCSYTAGTALSSLSQITGCLTIPNPGSSNSSIPSFPSGPVPEADASFVLNHSNSGITNNSVNSGYGWFNGGTLGFSAGSMVGENTSGQFSIYFYQPSNFAGWNFCNYPGGTPLTSLTQLNCLQPVSLPSTVSSAEGNLTLYPNVPSSPTANAVVPGINFSKGMTAGFASGESFGYLGTGQLYDIFYQPNNFNGWRFCTYPGGTALTSLSQCTMSAPVIATGTPAAGTYVDGGTGAWTRVPPTRAGSVTISGGTSQAVVFSTAMTVTPSSCSLTPSASAAATGTPFVTALSTTGFTANIPATGTLAMTYQCVVNNSN